MPTLTATRARRDGLRLAIADLFTTDHVQAEHEIGRLGVEREWFAVNTATTPPSPVPAPLLEHLLGTDPGLSRAARITFEPGGQLEVSPPPSSSAASLLGTVGSITRRLRDVLAPAGIELLSSGLNPWHGPDELGLQTPAPRYTVMQAHFDAIGPHGRRMMRQTAALQVCVDLGEPGRAINRWRLANLAGPALSSAFANSPIVAGECLRAPGGRGLTWLRVDPSRTGFDGRQVGSADDCVGPYLDFALNAAFMPLPRDGDVRQHIPAQPFARWLARGGDRPDRTDVDHHLSTLFPPVRPRHHLEIRYIDALPDEWSDIPVLVLAVLLYEPTATAEALECLAGQALQPSAWALAGTHAVADPCLRSRADQLFEIAAAASSRFPRGYLPADAAARINHYRERFIHAGRTPADEQLEAFQTNPEDLSPWR